jgi:excisionase family DNA binding protein
MVENDWVSVERAAALLEVSPSTVLALVKRGEIPAMRTIPCGFLVSERAVSMWTPRVEVRG